MAFFLTGKGRLATSFRTKVDAGNVNDLLEKRLPEEKIREQDQVKYDDFHSASILSYLENMNRISKSFSTGKY